MPSARHFKVILKRSPAGARHGHAATLRGIGLTRMGRTVYLKDTPAVRGMLYKVVHLVAIEACAGEAPPSARRRAAAAPAA